MKKEKFYQDLIDFIKNGTCSFTAIDYLTKRLKEKGYQELTEENTWHLSNGCYFVTRNDASLIAFQIGKHYKNSFNLITTHSDTPAFTLKPQNEIFENGYLKLNVAPYGGLLNYGWLDRPLSIAGKIIVKENNCFTAQIIDLKKPLLVIPSVAIHQNDKANSKLDLNTQVDLIPIIALKEEKDIIKNLISNELNYPENDILDYDLLLYNTEEPQLIGKEKDILLSPRIDNLTCTFSGFESFCEIQNENNINVFCTFNSEEIGSLTKEGADSNFLLDTLKKIAASLKLDISTSLHNSIVLSADNTHAVHPNHPDLADTTDRIYLNQGVVISKEMVTTTDSLSSSIFKYLCDKANCPYQEFSSRNDIASGSTLAGLSLRHVAVTSIDIGLAQLAMHSSFECIGKDDIYSLYQVFQKFYQASFEKQKKSTKITF